MKTYPTITTRDYDTAFTYWEGRELCLYEGKFTPKEGLPTRREYEEFRPVAVVKVAPTADNHDMVLLLVAEDWNSGGYERYKILNEITRKRSMSAHPDKIVVVPPSIMAKIKEHCSDVFDPCVKEGEKHEGMLYGMVVYSSYSATEIQVF